jgi:lambda family phage portal protein
MINTINTNVVGQGLIPEPTPDKELLGMSSDEATAWKKTVLRYWEEFAESKECDAQRRNNFYEIQQLAHRAVIESGDVFATMPYVEYPGSRSLLDLRIQLIEADCVTNPSPMEISSKKFDADKIFGGVEIGEYGEVVAYYVATKHPLSKRWSRTMTESVRIPAVGDVTGRRNILHLMRSMRPGQRRGVPALAPIVITIKQLDRYMKAELQSAIIQSLFSGYITSQMPEQTLGEFGSMYSDDDGRHPSQRFYEENGMVGMGAGTIGFMAPGDDIKFSSPTHPGAQFDPFVTSQLKMMGAALGLPFEMVVMMFSTSFSASRAAMNMATANFKTQRDWLTYDFCQPVYEEFMANIVAKGFIKAPGFFDNPILRRAYCLAKWSGPADLQIDAAKELQAYEKAIGLGAMTYSDVANKFGSDFRQNAQVLHEEQQIYDFAPWERNPLKVTTSQEKEGALDGGDETEGSSE